MMDNIAVQVALATARAASNLAHAGVGQYRRWPPQSLMISEPLALTEVRTNRLRQLYAKAACQAWDGEALFRDLMSQYGGIQLDDERKRALSYPLSMLMWGELAAWHVAAEMAERIESTDARMAASSQVFDEARHFYVLRDYVAALHVPLPQLEPYFAVAVRRLLATRDLTVKLFAMQILAEGTATVVFRFLSDSGVEPVLCELLKYVERDEARHVGFGVLYLPQKLRTMSPAKLKKVRSAIMGLVTSSAWPR